MALPYLAERYPDLKAAPAFARLHDELVDTEDRIAFARELFNATVAALNNRRRDDARRARREAHRPPARRVLRGRAVRARVVRVKL